MQENWKCSEIEIGEKNQYSDHALLFRTFKKKLYFYNLFKNLVQYLWIDLRFIFLLFEPDTNHVIPLYMDMRIDYLFGVIEF